MHTKHQKIAISYGLTGEKGLLAALIFHALWDLKSSDRHHRWSAQRFFEDNSITYKDYFSFLFCCQILNLCPLKLRKLLSKKGLIYRHRH